MLDWFAGCLAVVLVLLLGCGFCVRLCMFPVSCCGGVGFDMLMWVGGGLLVFGLLGCLVILLCRLLGLFVLCGFVVCWLIWWLWVLLLVSGCCFVDFGVMVVMVC